ncbi:MAG: type II toxin-antitoxin system RelE/ParE family toxin [Ignavibacteriales bacterium]|nr:type II toxin-antitoxin system RelE/ParE family toxin [Ignavibacteriales bacterium]
MNVIFAPGALKSLEKLDTATQKRIVAKLEFYFAQKNPLQYAEKMKDSKYGDWRFRIGDYRVLFDIEKDTANILKLGDRKEIYK